MVSHASQRLTLLLSFFTLLLCVFLALTLGAVSISFTELAHFFYLFVTSGSEFAREQYPTLHAIVLQIRLPRVIAAVTAGAALAIAGVCTQGLFRNPLASQISLG
ncbi:hemin ABC transporter [Vibrio ishigakensis]|uniref:Hemin ABC transporter n=1 Tax=Vibrio ishigakensis TaxID=1481914 RepID=A0A0B8PJ45_9VIBR|nr:hemin ABC transporter [Vibrio ishigakensis]